MIDFRKLNHLFFIAEFPSCISIESTIGILITKSKIIPELLVDYLAMT